MAFRTLSCQKAGGTLFTKANKSMFTYTMEYYSAINRKGMLTCTTSQVNYEDKK
jgi:hypothetical protein